MAQRVTGVFTSMEAAREAVRGLRAAGVEAGEIAVQHAHAAVASRERSARQAERAGREAGGFLADAGEAAAAFIPFVGTKIAEGTLSEAARATVEKAGAAARRVADALAESVRGVVAEEPPVDDDGRVRVSAWVAAESVDAAREALKHAGALEIFTGG